MADFTQGYISQDTGASGLPAQAPVARPSAITSVAAAGAGLLKQYTDYEKTYGKAQRELAVKNQTSQVASKFATQQLQIADAVDRGDMTSQKARRMMRVNFSKAIADNPSLQKEITDVHKNIISTKGLGAVAAEGTEQEQAQMKLLNTATQEGWVKPTMSQEEAMEAANEFAEFNRQQDLLQANTAQIQNKRAKLGFETDKVQHSSAIISRQRQQLALEEDKAQIRSRQAVTGMADNYFPKLKRDASEVIQQVENGTLDPRQAMDRLDSMGIEMRQLTSQLGGRAGSDYVATVVQPLLDTIDYAKKRASGQMDSELYETKLTTISQRSKLNLLGDPEVAEMAAYGEMFRNSDVLGMAGESWLASRMLANNSKEEGKAQDVSSKDPQVGTYLNSVKAGIKEVNGGNTTSDDPAKFNNEIRNNINKVLKGVNAYQMAVDDPSEYNQVVDFLASSEYGDYVSTNGTGIDKQNATAAREVLMQQYEQGAREAIVNEWEKAKVNTNVLPSSGVLGTSANMQDTTSLIQPTWNGTGVSFISQSDNPRVQAKVKDLNKRVAPVVNRLTRLSAHLNGDTNYEKVYKDNYEGLFGRAEGQGDEPQT